MSGNGSNAVEELEDFVRQWILTIELANEARKNGDFKALHDTASFSYISEGGNYVNYEGYRHLERAVQAILVEGRLTLQLTPETLQRFIVEEFFVELKRAKKKGKLSTRAIIERSKARIEAIRWSDGRFVYPLVFSSRSPTSYFSVGPATLMSKQNLEEEYEAMFRKEEAGRKTASPRDFYGDWLKYTKRYDHFIVVDLSGLESKLAWQRGREVAEFFLNLIRMTFGFQHTRNIKLAGGYIWDEESSRLRIDEYDEARFSSSSGPWGSHLGDEWMDTLNRQIGGLAWSWSSLASLIASGRHPDSPIAERQRYCHQLISEAYCEPHDHIRLVRMVSALEAIAVLDGPEKASALAWNCAQAGGFSNFEKALDIEAAVFNAYKVRNRIVHGDGASDEEIGGAFRGLEQHILDIVAGYTMLYVGVWNLVNPVNVSQLRAELKRRLPLFFWDTDLAFFPDATSSSRTRGRRP